MSDESDLVATKNEESREPRLHPKRAKEYFFEFLMLFLAVFLGFLAENYREEIAEQQQAQNLAQDYYDELRADSVQFHGAMGFRILKDSTLQYLRNYVRDSSLVNVSKAYVIYFLMGLEATTKFDPNDVVLEELKNSGSLRFLKNNQLQQLTGSLSVAITRLRQRNEFEMDFAQLHLIPLIVDHNDQGFFDKLKAGTIEDVKNTETIDAAIKILTARSRNIDYHINNLADFDRKRINNMVGIYQRITRSTTINQYRRYERTNSRLLALLRTAYNVK